MVRKPTPGSDAGEWGQILNDFLAIEHNEDGTLKKAGDITAAQSTANAKYTKPGTGIPKTDLSAGVQQSLDNADAAASGTIPDNSVSTSKIQNSAVNDSKISDVAQSKVTGLSASLTAKQSTSEKGQVSGYASLDGSGKVPTGQLPSAYTDEQARDAVGAALLVGGPLSKSIDDAADTITLTATTQFAKVIHGSNAATARPSATYVLWEGSVQPSNWVNGDDWNETA